MAVLWGTADERAAVLDRLEGVVEADLGRMEAEARLSDEVVDVLRDAGAFRMAMPAAWGGPELPMLRILDVLEDLAYVEGAVGWVVMIGMDGGFYSAWLDDEVGRKMYADLDSVTAGWVMPSGQATPVDGGYRLRGRWQFGSASSHADWFCNGALVTDTMEWRMLFVPGTEVRTVPGSWDTTGLRGSGSYDYEVEDVFVPAERTFVLSDPPRRPGGLYARKGTFTTKVGAVATGLARRALAEFRDLAASKLVMPAFVPLRDTQAVQIAAGRAEALIEANRAWHRDAVGRMAEVAAAGEEPSEELRRHVLLATAAAGASSGSAATSSPPRPTSSARRSSRAAGRCSASTPATRSSRPARPAAQDPADAADGHGVGPRTGPGCEDGAMRITSSQVSLAATSASVATTEVEERLRITRRGPSGPPPGLARQVERFEPSDALAAAGEEGEDEVDGVPPRLRVLIGLLERLTGREVQVADDEDLRGEGRGEGQGGGRAAGAQGPTIEYDRIETRTSAQVLDVRAQATVTTADGRSIAVDLQLHLAEATVERSEVHLRVGPQVKDPLVLDLGAGPGSLSSRVAFDIDADGTVEEVPWVADGAAFLALDRDGDGRIGDGSELFGPTSGNGFAELAALDDDGNGWVDEGDAAWSRLRLVTGTSTAVADAPTLAEAGVGAISTASVAAPWEVRSPAGETLALQRAAGLYLHEDGTAGTVRQLDVVV